MVIILKKVIIVLFIGIVLILSNKQEEYILIPNNAIRFRIIANSNNIEDQRLKYQIKEEITPILARINNNHTYEEYKEGIKGIIPTIDKIIKSKNIDYDINYGDNYFPEKTYKGVKYPEGNYESLVITLGDGYGDNWWCVLFPPLCLLEAQENNLDNYEYAFFIKDIISKY